MADIAIIGPGAVGATVAAWLSQDARHRVVVCARTPFDRIEVETPERTLTARPPVLTDPSLGQPAEWVLVATKAYDAASTGAWLRTVCGAATRVAVLQNGVEHVERFAPYLSAERIVPVVVECPAERLAPGRIRQRRPGWMLAPESPDGRAFAGLFSATGIETKTTPDFKTAAWRKLCLNCAGAVSAITLKPAGVVAIDAIADVMRGLIRECIAVGCAEGAVLPESLVEEVIAGYRKGPADSINSIHADRIAGRPMEVDARNGVIVRLGRKHGIPTPLNHMVIALLSAV
jgi:2-dehydropantoate 2-reductase